MRKLIGGQMGFINKDNKKFNLLKKQQIFCNGRSALYAILKKIKNKINRVYVPTYLCKSILQPIKEIGLNYKFYKIKNNFNYNLPIKKNSAVIFLNYFGNINKRYKFLKNNYKKNIFYIKDCTHDIFNKYHNINNFNKREIYKFASIRKYMPFSLGAITNLKSLKLNAPNKEEIKIFNRSYKNLFIRGKYFSYPLKTIDNSLEKKMLTEQSNFKIFENKNILNSRLPKHIERKLVKYNLKKNLKKRLDNYLFLKKELNCKINIISKTSSFPLYLTILLNQNNKKILKFLHKHRVFACNLWKLPKEVSKKKYKESHNLSKRLISLPVDHRYKKEDIKFMASILHKALKI